MALTTEPGLIHVIGREGNRRDAILTCGICGTRTEMHFYEDPGEPELDGALLWMFHFDKCEKAHRKDPSGLRLLWDVPGRPTENLELDPESRRLRQK
jgi:hypothetical protein